MTVPGRSTAVANGNSHIQPQSIIPLDDHTVMYQPKVSERNHIIIYFIEDNKQTWLHVYPQTTQLKVFLFLQVKWILCATGSTSYAYCMYIYMYVRCVICVPVVLSCQSSVVVLQPHV